MLTSLFNRQLVDFIDVRRTLKVALGFLLAASVNHLLLSHSSSFVLLLELLNGIGVSFGLSLVPKFSWKFFAAKHRDTVFVVLSSSLLLGSSIGPLLPDMFLSPSFTYKSEKDIELRNYFFFLLGITICLIILVCLFFKKNEENALDEDDVDLNLEQSLIEQSHPDLQEMETRRKKKSWFVLNTSLDSNVKFLFAPESQDLVILLYLHIPKLIKNKKFRDLLLLVSLSYGSVLVYNNLAVIIFEEVGYLRLYGSLLPIVSLFLGICSTFFLKCLDFYKKATRKFLILLSSLHIISLACCLICAFFYQKFAFALLFCSSSVFSLPIIPILFSLISDKEFNQHRFIVNQLAFIGPFLCAMVFQFFVGVFFMVSLDSILSIIWMFIFLALVCLLILAKSTI